MLNRIQKGSVALLIPVVIVVVSMAAAYGIAKFKKQDDTLPEEKLEEIAEGQAETVMGLPAGALKGKLDATPGSKEEKK